MKRLSIWNELNTIGLLDPDLKNPRHLTRYILQSFFGFVFLWLFFLLWDQNMTLSNKIIFDAEHPLAAGTALAFAAYEFEPGLDEIIFVMLCALSLASVHKIFWGRKWLKDLI